MSGRETFLQTFDSQVTLPERLSAYEAERCVSHKEGKTLWLLRRRVDGAQFLLRQEDDWEQLQENFRILTQVSQALPGSVPWPVDCFFHDGQGWLLRSWLPGQTLAQWRQARGGCTDSQCIAMGRALCRLLDTIHRLDPPVIHRDIKPENIVVDDQGRPQLIDFGIARQYRTGAHRDTRAMGTEGTAAPEQYGAAQTDPRTDIYALGMTLLWLRTGDFDRAGLDRLDPRLRRVLRRATDFAPDRRYKSAGSMSAALGRIESRPLVKLLALALLLAAVAVCVWQGHTALPQDPQDPLEPSYTQSTEVTFPSRCLEAAVRAALDRPEGPVTSDDLTRVERLALVGEHVIRRDQSFLYMGCALLDGEALPTEEQGDLRDLSLLADMPNLKELILCNQPLADLTPLAGLELETLVLGGCRVEDISVLKSCTCLRRLVLDSGGEFTLPVTGLEVLADLPLTDLSLYHIEVEDWSFLSELDQLWSLALRDPPSQALAMLPNMARLGELDINGYPEEDLWALKLPGLDTLTIRLGSMSLEGAQQLTGLGTISLVRCTAQDLSPLRELRHLISINLDGPELDYTQLNDLTGLQYVRVPAEYREKVEAACPGHLFQLLN